MVADAEMKRVVDAFIHHGASRSKYTWYLKRLVTRDGERLGRRVAELVRTEHLQGHRVILAVEKGPRPNLGFSIYEREKAHVARLHDTPERRKGM